MGFLNGLMDMVLFGPAQYLSGAADTLVNWVGSCVSGSCNSLSATYLDGLRNFAGDTMSWLTGAPVNALYGIFNVLPDGGSFPGTFHASVSYFGNALASVGFFLPVAALADCVSTILVVKVSLWALHFVRYGVSFMRGVQVERYRFNG